MGCHNTTNKHKQRNKEESACKKDNNSKLIIDSFENYQNKFPNGNTNICQKPNKFQTKDSKLEQPIIESKAEFETISNLTILEDVNKFYSFEMTIGSGSFGIVRKARKKISNKQIANGQENLKNHNISKKDQDEYYAIKSVWKDQFYHVNNGKADSDLKFLKNEIEILKQVDHDSIIRCFEIYEDKNNIHFVFEYINGSDLSSLFTNTATKIFNMNKSIEIFLQILEGIQYLHSKNIIHRDIKPENFLIYDINGKCKIKLIDFGFAVSLQNENEKIYETVGSLPYISPEMIKNEGYSHKTDIFSAGVVFFNLITGKQPFFGRDSKETLQSICNEKQVYPDFITNKILINFVDCMLEKEPEKRLSSSEATLHRLISQYKDLQQMQTVPKIFEPKFDNNKTMLDLIEFNKIRNFVWNVLLSEWDLGLAIRVKYYIIDLQNSGYFRKNAGIDEYPENLNQGRNIINYSKFLEIIIENNQDNIDLNNKLNDILLTKKTLCEVNVINFVDLIDYFVKSKNIILREKVWNFYKHKQENENEDCLSFEELLKILEDNCINVDLEIFRNLLIKRNLSLSNKINFETFDLIKEDYDKELVKKNKNI